MKSATEAKIQQEIVMFYHNTYCLEHHKPRCIIFSVPNGGNRSPGEAMKAKATGEYMGASDLVVIHFSKLLFVEVKTEDGVQSKWQKIFQKHIQDIGFEYHIVRSIEEFKELIFKYGKQ